jgi:hypothetical protein
MPFVYTDTPATPGNLTTNAAAGTATETFFAKPGTRNIALLSVNVQGKASAATSISGLVFRLYKWGTASTGGTTITPAPADPGVQVAKHTAASRSVAGLTRTNGPIFGCGKAGPGGYVAPTIDAPLTAEGGAAGSLNMEDVGAEASLLFEFSASVQE